MSRRAEVFLHGELAGTLSESSYGGLEFRFAEAYRERTPRPVLGQRFEDDLDRAWRARKGQTLPDFFANLIPEGRLRKLIEEAAGLGPGDDLGLLSFVGEDLPGAVAVRAAAGEDAPRRELQPPSPDGRPAVAEALLRFSLAGVQLKFSMLREEEKLVLPMKGRGGEWIVKFPSSSFPELPENENAILEWARATGFDVPECHLHAAEKVEGFPAELAAGGRVLAVRRYDRRDGGRIHQEDLAQAVGLAPHQKYEHVSYEAIASLVQRFVDPEAALELVRRLAFVVASGNGDAHLKNWSLVYPDRVAAAWSPVYDQVATVAWPEVAPELALKLCGVQRFDRVDRNTFARLAGRAGLDSEIVVGAALDTIARARNRWPEVALLLPTSHRRALEGHWTRVPLLRECGALT